MFRFSNLKINIAGAVVVLLTASMVLGNFVTVMFWKKGLVDAEINNARILTSLISTMIGNQQSADEKILVNNLAKIIHSKENIASAVYFNGNKTMYIPNDAINSVIEQQVRNSGMLREELIKIKGNIWDFFNSGSASLIVAQPVDGPNRKDHALCVEISLDSVYSAIWKDLKTVLVYLFVNALILFVIGWYRFVSLIVKPLEKMAAASEGYTINSGFSFDNQFSNNEFGQLTMAINSMLLKIEVDRGKLQQTVAALAKANKELINTQKEMVLTEKLASVGRLAAGLAHEIGNPLGIIQGYVELLEQPDIKQDDKKMYAERAMNELDRINGLIRQLLDFAKTSRNEREKISITTIFTELKEMLLMDKRAVTCIVKTVSDTDVIKCDRDGLRQVFLNCFLNALDAIEMCGDGRDGILTVTISDQLISEKDKFMIITIEDNGIGIGNDNNFEYFEPFYTTKEPGKGTGLGLSVSHSIVESHGGMIRIDGKSGVGAVVTIELPYTE